jgi:hypothetical protein
MNRASPPRCRTSSALASPEVDLGATTREADRSRTSDAAASASDQRDLAREFHLRFLLNRP